MDKPKAKVGNSIQEKLFQAGKEYKAERFCTYGIGMFSAAKLAAASYMHFDDRYTNGQVDLVLAGAAFFWLITYACSKVTKASKNRVSRLEGLLNSK